MNSIPSIGACIPCFNGARTLRRAVESIRAQTLPIGEVLVVDDGSTDGSCEIAWGRADRVVRLPRNLGRGAARNRCVLESHLDYILFCDSGMALDSAFTARSLEHFSSGRVAAVFGIPSNPDGRKLADRWRERHLFKSNSKQTIDREASLSTGGVLMHRAAILEVGNFDARLSSGEDEDMGRRLRGAGYKVIFDPALRLKPLEDDGVASVLARYTRWNCAPGHVPGWSEYRKLMGYARTMMREDIRARDLTAAIVSLFTPHYIFWTRRRETVGSSMGRPATSSSRSLKAH